MYLGINRIDSLSFVAPDEDQAAARLQAVEEATKDAKMQAKAILSALDLPMRKLQVSSVSVNARGSPRPLEFMRSAEALAMDSASLKQGVTLIGGQQQIEATVSVEWKIGDD